MKQNPHWRYALLLPAFLLLFVAAERLVPNEGEYWLSYLPLDDHIPFWEGFVVPYVLWYPLLFSVGFFLLLCDGENFKKYMLFIMGGCITALVFCLIFPNGQALRPESFQRENLFTWVVGNLYRIDTSTNVFPSMHVIGSVGAAVAAFQSEKMRSWRAPVLLVALAIILSTVFIKQHSILDVFGGLAWCIPLYFAIYALKKSKKTG